MNNRKRYIIHAPSGRLVGGVELGRYAVRKLRAAGWNVLPA